MPFICKGASLPSQRNDYQGNSYLKPHKCKALCKFQHVTSLPQHLSLGLSVK